MPIRLAYALVELIELPSDFIFQRSLASGLEALGIEVTAVGMVALERYFHELKRYSKKVNLIAKATADEQIVENHFLDSLTILPLLEGRDAHLLDIGTGAGFPGLVLKAARHDLRLSLVEPRLKRVSFCKHVIRLLGLEQVNVFASRVEDEGQVPAGLQVTHITSRAVTSIEPFLQMCSRFARPGLRVICMKGPKWQQEMTEAAEFMKFSPFVKSEHRNLVLPYSSARRTLLVFDYQGG